MRRLLFIAAFVTGVVGGCYLRPNAQPGFRYSCETDADCPALDCSGTQISREDADALIQGCDSVEVKADLTLGVGHRQTCVAGLCEYTCDIFTFADDCPGDLGFNFCFNGVCANFCGLDDYKKYNYDSNDDFCTDPQTCIPLDASGIDPALFDSLSPNGGGGGGGGGNSLKADDLPRGAGFCGLRCDADGAPACPPGQYCSGALCLPDCDHEGASPCADGEKCLAFGEFSSCLTACDPNVPAACGVGEVCVLGVGVCQPTCLGEDAVECTEGFECDVQLAICIPVGGEPETTTADSTT